MLFLSVHIFFPLPTSQLVFFLSIVNYCQTRNRAFLLPLSPTLQTSRFLRAPIRCTTLHYRIVSFIFPVFRSPLFDSYSLTAFVTRPTIIRHHTRNRTFYSPHVTDFTLLTHVHTSHHSSLPHCFFHLFCSPFTPFRQLLSHRIRYTPDHYQASYTQPHFPLAPLVPRYRLHVSYALPYVAPLFTTPALTTFILFARSPFSTLLPVTLAPQSQSKHFPLAFFWFFHHPDNSTFLLFSPP